MICFFSSDYLFIIKIKQTEFYGNNEVDDESYDLDNLDELGLSDEDLDVYAKALNSM